MLEPEFLPDLLDGFLTSGALPMKVVNLDPAEVRWRLWWGSVAEEH